MAKGKTVDPQRLDEMNAKKKKVDSENRWEFGQFLKRCRNSKGYTQPQMAEAVGQNYFTVISQIENGSGKIPTTDIHLWAEALGVPTPDLAKAYVKAYDRPLFEALFTPGDRSVVSDAAG